MSKAKFEDVTPQQFTAKVGNKGQVTIPDDVRRALDVKHKDYVQVIIVGVGRTGKKGGGG